MPRRIAIAATAYLARNVFPDARDDDGRRGRMARDAGGHDSEYRMSELSKRMRAVADAATPGPWEPSFDASTRSEHNHGVIQVSDESCAGIWHPPECEEDQDGYEYATENDANLIAASRVAVPQLCDEIESLEAEVARLRKQIVSTQCVLRDDEKGSLKRI